MPAVDFYYVSMCSVEKFISGHNTHEQGQSPEYVATIAPTKLVKGGKISTTIIFSQNKKKGVWGGGCASPPPIYIPPPLLVKKRGLQIILLGKSGNS